MDNLISIYKNKSTTKKNTEGKSLVEMRGLFLSYLENREKFNLLPSLPEESQNIFLIHYLWSVLRWQALQTLSKDIWTGNIKL